ncbi:hypothetical protein [Mycoplasma sp. 125]|uniref:hypothetical protein n=1 Tax=Mycoplasma sp. 125 TaxID=3447505 RepID=UPI003F655870
MKQSTCTKQLERKLKETLKNILNSTIPGRIFYYAINSSVERPFKTAQLSYPICFKIKNIKHWTEISKIEDQLIDYFNSISPKLKRNSNKNCFRKITEGDPGWYVDYHFKNKTHFGAVKYLNEYYAPVDTNGNRVNFSKKIKVLFCMNSSCEYCFKTPENRYKANSD